MVRFYNDPPFGVVVVVIFYFSSQDTQANLPSRRGRDVPISHKQRIWCDDRKKIGKPVERIISRVNCSRMVVK